MSRESLRRVVAGGRTTLTLGLALLFAGVTLAPQKASAIPAFARKYETSCATCHVAIPALTPFGEAFRANGYRFPEGQDAAMTKSPPIPMGAEGYKKLWPDALWPGQIPGMPPIAVLMENEAVYEQDGNIVTFGGMGGEVEVLTAGTLDEHLSFWGSLEFARGDNNEAEVELARVNLQVRPLSSPALQFRIGAIAPGIMLVSNHRSIMDQKYWALTERVGDNPWQAEPIQQGVEAFGVVQHRVLYSTGVVEGSGSVGDKSKDFYGRLAFKWGGLAFDGVSNDESAGAANPKPWSEKSVAVSAFGYHGKSFLDDGTGPTPEDQFDVFGGDIALSYLDVTARGGYTDRKDDRLLVSDPTITDEHVRNAFAEAYWVAYPWLIPAARYEWLKVIDDRTQRLSITLNGLVRANVKTFLAADWVKEPEAKFVNEEVALGLLVGF
jgi:hypothetical protein